jgi:DNA-binding protein HU-beta
VEFAKTADENKSKITLCLLSQNLDTGRVRGLTYTTPRIYHGFPFVHISKEEKMIKLDIVNQVADKTGVPKQKAEQVVDSLFNAMKEALARGKRIELRGFGVFVVKPRKRGVGRNPRTGKEVPIPAGKTIRFKPGKELSAKAV